MSFKEAKTVAVIVGVTLICYLRILWGFFQQDEWLSFAYRFLAQESGFIGTLKDSFAPSVGHYQPLNSLIINILFSLFKVHYFPYAIVSLILHLTNVYLVYRLAKNYFKEIKAAVIVSLIFGVSAATFQATSWVLADIGVHFSTLFAILSVSALLNFSRTSPKTAFRKTIIFLIISLLFKEISIGLFAFIPLVILFSKKISNKKEYIFKALVVACIYVVIRVAMIFLPISYSRDTLATESQPINMIVYNLITLPAKGLTQSIVPQRFLVGQANFFVKFLPERITGAPDTPSYDLFVQNKVLEAVTFLNFMAIFGVFFILLKKNKNSVLMKASLLAALFVFVNSPVFALAPERSGRIFIIDSRNLYLLAVGSSFVVYCLLATIFSKRKIFFTAAFSVVLALNIYGLNKELIEVSSNGIVRRNILQKIYSANPTLPGKVVFYTESNSSLYGLSDKEKILPFQSGFGQTLLVWYQPTEKFPREFFKNRFLWEIADQGYKLVEDRGFGYFRDFELLSKTINKENIPIDFVIAFRYDSQGQEIEDMTMEVRGRLRGYLARKKEIKMSEVSLGVSANPKDINFVRDERRETFWNSKIPYANPQYIEIFLDKKSKVAQVQIDSYNNKDQNEVGYRISLLGDDGIWHEVFYAERYPPNKDGIVNLYFEPKVTSRVKIEQVGYHIYASWAVHELKIYNSIQEDSAINCGDKLNAGMSSFLPAQAGFGGKPRSLEQGECHEIK